MKQLFVAFVTVAALSGCAGAMTPVQQAQWEANHPQWHKCQGLWQCGVVDRDAIAGIPPVMEKD